MAAYLTYICFFLIVHTFVGRQSASVRFVRDQLLRVPPPVVRSFARPCQGILRLPYPIAFLLILTTWTNTTSVGLGQNPFQIEVVDSENGWPVPLVQLTTTNNVRYVTDNAGKIAFDIYDLMDAETWLSLEGDGYTVPSDGFGYRGVKLRPTSGGKVVVKVQRQVAAKRLGRITGAGLLGESQKLNQHLDWNSQGIVGCDSVQNAVHDGRLFWSWGDTTLANYPLGRFHMIGAQTNLQPLQTFEPPIKLKYHYFVDKDQIPRNIAVMPGEGPTWLGGYASLPDKSGVHHLVATYSKVEPPLSEYERGLCVWNEQQQRFDRLKVIWRKSEESPIPPATPHGHSVAWTDEKGQRFVLFGDPFPAIKCLATYEAWTDPDSWEILKPQSFVLDQSGKQIKPHRGSIAWNPFRQKWITVFTQYNGEASFLGEVWYAEADSPLGNFENARHIATHKDYSFYNPKLHPEFVSPDSPIVVFEGTYSHTFSKTATPVPGYDYNQLLYRLDLDELFPDHQ